jgi:hypothetical protein
MINRTGLTGMVKNVSKPISRPNNMLSDLANSLVSTNTFRIVTDVVLDETHPSFDAVGGWGGVGTIFFTNLDGTSTGKAQPLFPNIKSYPTIREVVLIVNDNSKVNSGPTTNFYINNISLWGSPNYNPTEFVEDTQLSFSPSPFTEKNNIHPIISFSGDTIYEGRFGNSIRLGNTFMSPSEYKNNWSTTGSKGDPITIIRNGQPLDSSDIGYYPIVEDINKDLSSIYQTSTQVIPIRVATNENYNSYVTPPISPSTFSKPQIILNSDRIVINSKSDSILFSSQKSIGLSSNESINIDTKQFYISGIDIKLGSKDATQPALLGNDTVTLLKQLTTEVRNLAAALQTAQIFPNGVATPDAAVQSTAQLATNNLNNILTRLSDDINGIKSKNVKLI